MNSDVASYFLSGCGLFVPIWLLITHVQTGKYEKAITAGVVQDTRLEHQLAGYSVTVLLAGDCLAPRSAEEAVLEGLRAGLLEAS